MPTAAARVETQARPGGGGARRVALPPSHTHTHTHTHTNRSSRFPFAQLGRPARRYIHRAAAARAAVHAPPILVPACLPAFPSPLPARSTCSSGGSSKRIGGRRSLAGLSSAPLLLLAAAACFDRLSNQEQRQIRGFLESGRSIKSQVSCCGYPSNHTHQIKGDQKDISASCLPSRSRPAPSRIKFPFRLPPPSRPPSSSDLSLSLSLPLSLRYLLLIAFPLRSVPCPS